MSKKQLIIIYTGSLLYVIYHLATLSYSPIAWFDEVPFAGITDAFMTHGQFYDAALNISWEPSQLALAYGPIYFMLQALIIKIFGLSIFTFRMSNMFFGLADLVLIYKICRQLKFNEHVTLLTVLLIAFDPQFNQFLHSGRMDFIALFFFLCSYLIYMGINNDGTNKYLLRSLLTGFFIACAFLTTPRMLFAFSFYFFFFFYELIAQKFKNVKNVIIKNLVVLIAFAIPVSVWVFIEFGSFGNYILQTFTNSPGVKEHVGITSVKSHLTYNMLIYIGSLLCFFVLVARKKVQEYIHVLLLTVPAIIMFLFIVGGGISGRYYGMVVPFTTILIIGGTVNAFNNLLSRIIPRLMLCLFVIIFLFKATYIFATFDQRNPTYYSKIITGIIPPEASVAGNVQYYYIAKQHGCTFQSLERNGTLDQMIAYFKSHKCDYIIVNKNWPLKGQYEETFLKDRYKLVATVDDKDFNVFFHKIIDKLPYKISESYACYIYKRTGE